MIQLKRISLREYNTFHIDVKALYSFFCTQESDIYNILERNKSENKQIIVLGGGSNMLFAKDVKDILIIMRNKGIEVLNEDKNHVFLKVAAGEVWDDFVSFCVKRNYGGVENLSLIPGTVGASPVQNIGAYGVEVKDVIEGVEAVNIETGEKHIFKNGDCDFAYRNSVFKNELKNKYIILNVTFKLTKEPKLELSYGNLKNEIVAEFPKVSDVREAVIRIRESKLPNPEELPNAGSFFKNPVIPEAYFLKLKREFPELVSYLAGENKVKAAAGQLIDLCGFKGLKENGVGVHEKQALVLVNYDNADGKNILQFSEKIQQKVFEKFGIRIEREVNVYA
jgi:UDP-N-acetylmuramate dehydrogenase